jgi:microcystin degradation protein MlrC
MKMNNQLQNIHHNAQAIFVLTSSVDKEEFNHVDVLDLAKDVWKTLQMAHKGSKPVRMAKIKCLRVNSIDQSCVMMKPLKTCSTG